MHQPVLDSVEKSLLIMKLRTLSAKPVVAERFRGGKPLSVVDTMDLGSRTWTVFVEDGEAVLVTDIVFQLGEVVTECSCSLGGDCPHVAAAAHYFLTGQTSPPAPSPKIALAAEPREIHGELQLTPATQHPLELDRFAVEFEKRLGKKLTTSEMKAAQRIDFIYAKYGSPAKISRHDLVPLVDNSTFWHGMGSTHLWRKRPPNVWEAWLHLALVLRDEELKPLPGLERITPESEMERVLGPEIKRAKVEEWRGFVRDALKMDRAREKMQLEQMDLRLRLHGDSIELVARRGEETSFSAITHADFRELALERPITSVILTRHARIVWEAYTNDFLEKRPTTPRMTHASGDSGAILRCLFEHPDALMLLENPLGESFVASEDRLVWRLAERDVETSTYALELALENGSPLPPPLCIVPCESIFYFTLTHILHGPPAMNLLEKLSELKTMPAEVIESREGIQFLERLGAELPPSLQSRVVRLQPTYRISITGSDERLAWEKIQAELHADFGQEGGLERLGYDSARVQRQAEPQEGRIIFRDSSRHVQARNWMLALQMAWSQKLLRWTRAGGERLPEELYTWLQTLPPEVEVTLDPLLDSIRTGNLTGRLGLNMEKTEMDWFDLQLALDVEDNSLMPDEIKALLKANGRWVNLKGRGYRRLNFDFTPEDARHLADLGLGMNEIGSDATRLHALQLAHPSVRKFLPSEQVEDIQTRANDIKTGITPEIPETITATLRHYQVEGFHFLAYLSTNRFGGLLADDMGLGKTLQTLTWIAWLRQQPDYTGRPVLVVCPKSVTDNWLAEARKFLPSIRARRYNSAGSTNAKYLEMHLKGGDLFVLNYAQMRNLQDELTIPQWHAVILDEAQYIKNPTSQTTQAACKLQATHRLAVSGTPIENRLLDLWSIMGFAMPGMLGPRATFLKNFNQKDDPEARRRLAARVRPFLLRRTKQEVAHDLPERIEEDRLCEMEGEQQTLYNAELKRAQQILLQVETDGSLDHLRFTILGSLTRLRQICCHPALVAGEKDSSVESTKLNALMDLLEPLMEEGHKVLLFSQYVSMLELIKAEITRRDWHQFLLTGATDDRGALVDAFQKHDGPSIFLISLKAGGSGLNLTAASYVIIYDPWWNPAVENQAIDRSHRIGQKNTVIAYRLLVKDSIEEKIRELQKTKGALAADILGEESMGKALTKDDFRFLLGG